jgi:hypothetical protein
LKKIKKKKKDAKKKTKQVYANFVKSAVLEGDKEVESKDAAVEEETEETKEEEPQVAPLSDEQLLAACGGRTAHKAARHGHKLSGKLARLQQQDEVFKTDRSVVPSWT